jgi:hypothetical protein
MAKVKQVMKSNRLDLARARSSFCALVLLLSMELMACAQAAISDRQRSSSGANDMDSKVAELDDNLRATREELAQSREEIRQLRVLLENLGQNLADINKDKFSPKPAIPPASVGLGVRVSALEEAESVLQSQVAQQDQVKLESKSKYPIKISGLVLLNAGYTRGSVDSVDVPQFANGPQANSPGGSFSATMRQSILGIEARGPTLWGAKSSANLYADFFGGFSNTDFGVTSGILRFRTGGIRLDWSNTSFVASQEAPFFSPLSPTSLATLGLPALGWAGNLWTWTPQLRVEHTLRLSSYADLKLQAGILDPVLADQPVGHATRQPSPGEQSRQPGYATRISWSHHSNQDRPLALGIGGYFSPQQYPLDRRINAWAGTADFQVPLGRQIEFLGEAYRGKAVGGLGGGQFASFVASSDLGAQSTKLVGLDSLGAWGQLKFKANSRLEFNAAMGHDNPFASELERFPFMASSNVEFARNQTSFVNVIFKPEASVLFSVELRHIQSYPIVGKGNTADHINLAAAYQF